MDSKDAPDKAPSASPPRLFGRYLVDHDVIDEAALEEALELMRLVNRTVGQLATARGLISAAQAERVATLQREVDGRWGEIALAAGFGALAPRDVDALLAEQAVNNLRLSDALVELGHLSPTQIDSWWARYEQEHGGIDPIASMPEAYRSSAGVREIVHLLPRTAMRVLGLAMRLGTARPWTRRSTDDIAATVELDGGMRLEIGIVVHGNTQLLESDVVQLLTTTAWHAARRLTSTSGVHLTVDEPQRGVVPRGGVAIDAALGDATCTLVLAHRDAEAQHDGRTSYH